MHPICLICSKPFPTHCRCNKAAFEAWRASKKPAGKRRQGARPLAVRKIEHSGQSFSEPATPAATSTTPQPPETLWTPPDPSEIRKLIAETNQAVYEARENRSAFMQLRHELDDVVLNESRRNRSLSAQLRHRFEEIVRQSHACEIGGKGNI